MSFIRPEARAQLWRIRELLAAGAVVLLGLYWITGPGGLLAWLGWGLVPAGLALAFVGLRRLRFRQEGHGPGIVQIDEGQIAYFGPLSGGAVAMSEVERLILDPTGSPAHWVLEQPGNAPLHIPVNAEGTDGLFDAFGALPAFRTDRMLTELGRKGGPPVVIWERSPSRPASALLQ
ncbi:MAG: hypothetical protein AB3N23_21740 [Paracoccaceae bacterium]